MIKLYTWTTPNGRKVSILLEELGLPYEVHAIDIGKNEQFSSDFLKIAPNNKIPAIVDDEGPGGPISIFESGAILTYLAEKTGRFLPASGPARYKTLEWLNWQMGGLGPMLGQLGYFGVRASEKVPHAIERFTTEADRLLGVMDRQLAQHEYLAGAEYSIADIASYAWTLAATTLLKDTLAGKPENRTAVHRWLATVGARPAVQRGMLVPKV